MGSGVMAVDAYVVEFAGVAQLLDGVSQLLVEARLADALVVHLQNDGAIGAVDEPGTPGWELYLAPRDAGQDEVIIRKSSDDGFVGTGLGELLDGRDVRRVVIAGLLSEMCVSATARAALALGLSVVAPRDAHGTYDLDEIPAAVVARVAEHNLGDLPCDTPRLNAFYPLLRKISISAQRTMSGSAFDHAQVSASCS